MVFKLLSPANGDISSTLPQRNCVSNVSVGTFVKQPRYCINTSSRNLRSPHFESQTTDIQYIFDYTTLLLFVLLIEQSPITTRIGH